MGRHRGKVDCDAEKGSAVHTTTAVGLNDENSIHTWFMTTVPMPTVAAYHYQSPVYSMDYGTSRRSGVEADATNITHRSVGRKQSKFPSFPRAQRLVAS